MNKRKEISLAWRRPFPRGPLTRATRADFRITGVMRLRLHDRIKPASDKYRSRLFWKLTALELNK